MTPEVYLVLLEFGQEHERAALELLLPTLRRLFPERTFAALSSTTPTARTHTMSIGHEIDRVSGDNTLREFSGWDRGIAWLEQRYAPAPESIVVLANDTVARADKHDRVRDMPADRVAAASRGALVGWIDEYPRACRAVRADRCASGSIPAWSSPSGARSPRCVPLAQPLDDRCSATTGARIFREPSPLSENYRAYLRTYFFGGRIDGEFEHALVRAGNRSPRTTSRRSRSSCAASSASTAERPRARARHPAGRHPAGAAGDRPPALPRGGLVKVSVIIPCYNLGEYLDEAVGERPGADLPGFRDLIVDDGSTDAATQALLADYRRPKTPCGSDRARRACLRRETSRSPTRPAPTCARWTRTIVSSPTYFAKAVPILDADPSVAFASCWLRDLRREEWEWKPERCDLPTLLWENTVLTAALVRREAVLAVGGYDTQMPVQGDEDWDLWLTLVERGYRGVILPEVLFNYRRRAGSMSTISWYGPGHLPLASYRFAKHWRHVPGAPRSTSSFIRTRKPRTLLRRNDEIERYLAI